MNTTNATETNELGSLFTEMRAEKSQKRKLETQSKKFEVLPDGDYNGRVHILTNTVVSEKSPNYGRTKYEIRLTVTGGEHKGQMAYHHRLLLPANLANKPAETDVEAVNKWKREATQYLSKTDEIMAHCGVDVSDNDMNRFTLRIAENNKRNSVVNFTMKNGVPYINRLVKSDPASDEDGLFITASLPDGDDAPFQ